MSESSNSSKIFPPFYSSTSSNEEELSCLERGLGGAAGLLCFLWLVVVRLTELRLFLIEAAES